MITSAIAVRDLVDALAASYKDHPTVIAELCDEHLDPSGAMLGWVREAARLNL